jgi:hypothetical protein
LRKMTTPSANRSIKSEKRQKRASCMNEAQRF